MRRPSTGRPRAPGLVAADVVITPGTRFLREAAAAGAQPLDGLGMLVEQAVVGLRWWQELEADRDRDARRRPRGPRARRPRLTQNATPSSTSLAMRRGTKRPSSGEPCNWPFSTTTRPRSSTSTGRAVTGQPSQGL